MNIRSAREDDLDKVHSLWRREGGPTSYAGGRQEALALLQRDPEALLIACHDAELVGTLIVGWDGWRCHMYRLVVEPAHRRAGVASALFDEAKRRAQFLGVGKIDAMVDLGNDAAIRFWENSGFAVDPRDGRWSLRVDSP